MNPYGAVPRALSEAGKSLRGITSDISQRKVSKARADLGMAEQSHRLGKEKRQQYMETPNTVESIVSTFLSKDQAEAFRKTPLYELSKNQITTAGKFVGALETTKREMDDAEELKDRDKREDEKLVASNKREDRLLQEKRKREDRLLSEDLERGEEGELWAQDTAELRNEQARIQLEIAEQKLNAPPQVQTETDTFQKNVADHVISVMEGLDATSELPGGAEKLTGMERANKVRELATKYRALRYGWETAPMMVKGADGIKKRILGYRTKDGSLVDNYGNPIVSREEKKAKKAPGLNKWQKEHTRPSGVTQRDKYPPPSKATASARERRRRLIFPDGTIK